MTQMITNNDQTVGSVQLPTTAMTYFDDNADHASSEGENLAYSLVVLLITVLLITTSVLTILVVITSRMCDRVVGHYLISLAVTDLLCGTLVTPLSIYAALDQAWKFSNLSSLCKIEAYLGVVLWSSTVYIFIWTGVDRYAALKKPARYDAEQTLTRCKCWIIFSWLAAILLCCPTLFFDDQKRARYDRDTFLCYPNFTATYPYTATLAVLVVAPALISVCHSYAYIVRSALYRQPRNADDNRRALVESDSSYFVTFMVILSFGVSWAPYFALRAYEALVVGRTLQSRCLQFAFVWLAIAGGSWKFLIYCLINRDFRTGLRYVYRILCTTERNASLITSSAVDDETIFVQ